MNNQETRITSHRKFVFTLFNYTEDEHGHLERYLATNAKYAIIGREICPTTERQHLQGYINFRTPRQLASVRRLLFNRAHVEPGHGNDLQNQEYCRKSGNYWEHGTPGTHGQRSDLDKVVSLITSGTVCLQSIARSCPKAYIRYSRGINEYIKTINPITPRDFKTLCRYYYGPPGSGKSRRALEEATETTHPIYYKPRGDWWDGYRQHPNVIIDDFYGWLKYDELLKICDRYPYKVPIKGGYEEFNTKSIWITSNVTIEQLYKFNGYNPAAILRRFEVVEEIL